MQQEEKFITGNSHKTGRSFSFNHKLQLIKSGHAEILEIILRELKATLKQSHLEVGKTHYVTGQS